MASVIPVPAFSLVPAQSSKTAPSQSSMALGVARLPTDPFFYASLTLQNVLGGSRYRITRNDTGAELASGLVPGAVATDHVIAGIPAYSNPMLMRIVVRNASGATKYKAFETFAYLYKTGGAAYIIQQVD